MSPNMAFTILNATSIQLVATTDNGQVGVGINGRWRYNSASVTGTFTSGAAGTYPVYATASDNSFVTGPPETDSTVYSFALAIPASGTPATVLWRQIGTIVWNGSAIVDANLLFDDPAAHGGVCPGDYLFSAAGQRAGALLCDGSSYLRTAFPGLFNVIGTVYGSVDGTHFTVPDCRGRAMIGIGAGAGLTARAAGNIGGEETHLLTAAESGTTAHGHPSGGSAAVTGTSGNDAPDHAHLSGAGNGFLDINGIDGFVNITVGGGNFGYQTSTQGANTRHAHPAGSYAITDPATPNATAASASSAHNTMMPWIAGFVYIKT